MYHTSRETPHAQVDAGTRKVARIRGGLGCKSLSECPLRSWLAWFQLGCGAPIAAIGAHVTRELLSRCTLHNRRGRASKCVVAGADHDVLGSTTARR